MAIAGWRFPQPQGDQFRLGGSVQQLGVGDVVRFLRTRAASKPSRTNSRRTFSTVRMRQPTASLIFSSFQPGPSMSALSKITALRSFSDLPFSFLTVASQIARFS